MTYKRADRPGWPRLRAQRFITQRLADGPIAGYATLLQMTEVVEPLLVTHHEQQVCIADNGYSWLQIFPEGAHYTHTTMFDAAGQPVQDYIDLVAEHGIDDAGIPWYDDLYLDLAWVPEGGPLLLDQDELEAAHAIGAVTQEHYDLARGETARLLVALTLGEYTLPELARAYYPMLRAALDERETLAAAADTVSSTAEPGAPDNPTEKVEAVPASKETTTSDDAQHEPEATPSTSSIGAIDNAPDGEASGEQGIEHVDRPGEDDEQHA
jgi:predicted RNA-binding protein associated with RNAse of E/G family